MRGPLRLSWGASLFRGGDTEVDTKSPAPAKAQPYTLAGAGLLVSTSVDVQIFTTA